MRYPFHEISRRGFLLGSGLALTAARIKPAEPSCILTPEQEQGPYYIDYRHLRRELTEGKEGVPVTLRVALVDSRTCAPLGNCAVDIWHCDAMGVYSGFTAAGGGEDGPGRGGPGGRGPGGRGFGPPGGPPPDGVARGKGPGGAKGKGRGPGGSMLNPPGDETRFLRGVQVTNRQGIAEFTTIYPGWYAGRTIHIHLKTHVGGNILDGRLTSGHVSHTGQIFFPEDVTADIAKLAPYANHSNVHRTLHSEDHIFLNQGGSNTIVTLDRKEARSNAAGFAATVTVAVNPEATPVAF